MPGPVPRAVAWDNARPETRRPAAPAAPARAPTGRPTAAADGPGAVPGLAAKLCGTKARAGIVPRHNGSESVSFVETRRTANYLESSLFAVFICSMMEFAGQVVRTRWYSTKIFFFDVLSEINGEVMSFMFRRGEVHERGALSSTDILELSSQTAPGDEIRVKYVRKELNIAKGERSFDAYSVDILRAWSQYGNGTFDELPPAPRPEEALSSVTASSRAPSSGEICKFWVNTGRCQLGSACALRHCAPEERSTARQEWLGR